ncbi:S8 family serine peptidase [Paenisporosarcina indica]|uniref:S8 family serine peptidase n=1 Tax=Paenisporosarcina indica TaxID=650093 RepID=UPI00094FE6BA|nr:S8 family serine peptidase [Paenisporosarcina indica]
MSNKTRKGMMLAIAASLALSTASFGAPAPTAAAQLAKQVPILQLEKPAVKIPDRLVNPENPSEKVRIIVELEKAPAIETATRKGVLYKELPTSQRNSLEAAIEKDQVNVKANISKLSKNISFKENFTTVFNGFSAEVDAKDVPAIAKIAGVKSISESTEYARPVAQPEMTHSKELVQAQLAWEKFNFKGEGMVVGVIDTGIDPSHRDFILTDNASGDITSAEVGSLIDSGSIEPGKYYTAKVPYGYNYMDGNQEIRDLGPGASMHGMHVSGTVGANGDEEKGGIKGVAPEAQLLALKVFGNDPLFPSTFGDIYVKAMDDAIKLGADVINMSLGSTAGYVDNSNPEQMAVTRAQENGLLVAISAGNSDMFGSGAFYPMANNQDYGLTGSPSVSEDSFGVASFENSYVTASSFTYEVDGVPTGRAMFLLANDAEPNDLPLEEYPIEFAGFGSAADFAGKDLTGKIALVSRGNGINFVDKGLNAQAAGAAGVIVFNNVAGTISMASSSEIKIPFMSALQVDGLALKAALNEGKEVTVGFDGQYIETASPTAGKMSSFTSWGPTPNLDFKPEITAPGGNIFSTLNNDEYGLMSGTSMAAPHVAGGTALVMERVNEEFNLTGAARVQFAKNLMMNTSKPVVLAEYPDQDGNNVTEYVSPRRQGAGIMQLANALETDVLVTNKATGEAKVALKEIKDGKFSFTLKAKNYSDEAKNYNVDVQLQTDYALTTSGYDVVVPNIAGSTVVTDLVDVDAPSTVAIPANGEVEIQVSVDASELAGMEGFETFVNGFFIDGFVTLKDPTEETSGNVPLTVPFFGFNGSWDDASIFDEFLWDDLTYWGYQALADEHGDFISGPSLGEDFDPTKFAFSPNADGNVDKAIPVYSLVRNAKNFEVNVLDANGKKVRTIRTAKNLTKHYADTATSPGYTYNQSNGWDGKINGKLAADGQYSIELRAVIDFEGAEWQSVEFPIILDTVAPTADLAFNAETKTVTIANAKDNQGGVGIDRVEVLVNGKEVTQSATLESYVIEKALVGGDQVTVKVWDIAGNVTVQDFDLPKAPKPYETKNPVIYFETPQDYFWQYDTSEVVVSGTVEDDSNIVSLKVNGEVVKLGAEGYFTHTLTLEDGVKNVNVEAIDEHGNKMAISRKIFVDTTLPTVVASSVPSTVGKNAVDPTIKVTIGDNFDEVRLYLNGSEVFAKELSEPYAMLGFSQTVDVVLPLKDGKNEFELKVVDLVGHQATQTVSVNKADVVTPPTTDPNPPVVNPPVVNPPVTFSDVSTHWAKKEIEALATKKIILGKTAELFAPDAKLTRAEFSVLVARALDLELKAYEGKFSDVPASKDWAYAGLEAAARAGIINGLDNGKFNPDAQITREEIATIIVRAVKYADASLLKNLDTSKVFADNKKISAFAQQGVKEAVALGIVNGRAGNVFAPQDNATRAESAVMLYRALNKLGDL